MKKIIITLLAAAAGLLLQIPASAQSNPEEETIYNESVDAINLFKTVDGPNEDGEYMITLSTFVTGSRTVQEEGHAPVDFCIIMDLSGSMAREMNYSEANPGAHNPTEFYLHKKAQIGYGPAKNWKYPNGSSSSNAVFNPYSHDWTHDNYSYYYYKHTDGKFYRIYRKKEKDKSGADYYYVFYHTSSGGTRYFLGKKDGVYTASALSGRNRPTGGTKATSGKRDADGYPLIEGFYSTSENDIIYDGPLYTGSRMDALNEAVDNFIDQIKKDDDNNVPDISGHHRIGLVKFAEDHTNAIGNHFYNIFYDGNPWLSNYSQQLLGLTDVTGANVTTLKNTVASLVPCTNTRTDYGLQCGNEMLDGETDRHRVVVLFTDGDPKAKDNNPSQGEVANKALKQAKIMKDKGDEVFVIAVSTEISDWGKNFMNYASSNYPNAESMDNFGTKKASKYYIPVTNSSELADAFEKVAETSSRTDIGYKLDDSNSVVFDALTKHFMLRDDILAGDLSKISVGTRDFKEKIGTSYNFESGNPVYLNPSEYKVTLGGTDNKEIYVSGFNYAENWVGYITSYQGTSTPNKTAHGKELVIQIPIVVDPANPGGVSVPTNDPQSGVYFLVDGHLGDQIKLYPIPTVTAPNIVIIKNGLKEKDSAIFKISRLNDDGSEDATYEPFVVMETADASGTAKARIKLVDEGRYKVTEEPWSWAYTTTPETSYAEDDGKTSGSGNYIIRNVNGTTANAAANATLYIFNNEPKKNMPAHDEDAVNNVFFTPNTLIQVVK